MKRSCRIFSMILGLLLCVSLLTGCNTNKDPNTPKHTRDNGRKLTIYCTENDPYQKRLIDAYNTQVDEKEQIAIKNSKFLKPLILQGVSPVQCSVFMYFPLFLPLRAETRESFLCPADYLVQQPCGSTLRFPCSVSVDRHRGIDIGVP